MSILLSILLLVPAILVTLLTAIYAAEVLAGCLSRGSRVSADAPPAFAGRVGVLVPAHNEELGIEPTLRDIQSGLRPGDRLLVVADNCTDRTAEIARALGAEVVERSNAVQRGKGYALAYGIERLSVDPPDVVIIVDSDCRIARGTLVELAAVCAQRGRPVQSLYEMTAPPQSEISQRVAEFAWRVRNDLRPLGLHAYDLPCQLMGTGMAFPWSVLASADLASGHIVEDMKLGLDLARAGRAAVFHPAVIVSSTFPTSAAGVSTQRQRWEHGHIGVLVSEAVPLLVNGLRRRDVNQVCLALDLAVPPLALLSLLVMALVLVTGGAAWAGLSVAPFLFASLSAFLMFASTVAAWKVVGREILPAQDFVQIPFYIAAKIPLYLKFLTGRRASDWVRSDRSGR